jgi:DNA (cytosine-5)-methyltransferase 1
LLTPTLELLNDIAIPWVVENVLGARPLMPNAAILHGGMFGLGVHRPRLFSSNLLLLVPKVAKPPVTVGVYGKAPDGRMLRDSSVKRWKGRRSDGQTFQRAAGSLVEAQTAMGMDWADWHGTKEAVPPAYTEYIGAQLLAAVRARAGATLAEWTGGRGGGALHP